MTRADQTACPCGSGAAFGDCCGPILADPAAATTAEALMRSRYTAYARGDGAHLLKTWDARTRPARIDLDPRQRWLGLKIIATTGGGARDDQGTVEFVARSKIDGRGHRLHEISRFRRAPSGWRYVDGERGASDGSRRR